MSAATQVDGTIPLATSTAATDTNNNNNNWPFPRPGGGNLGRGNTGARQALATPVVLMMITLAVIVMPLLLARNKERPRRMMQVWGYDVSRAVVAYGLTEVLIIWLFFEDRDRALGLVAPKPKRVTPDVNNRRFMNAGDGILMDSKGRKFGGSYTIRVAKNLMVMRLLEIVPGLIFIYAFYMTILMVGRRVKGLSWLRRGCQRRTPRTVRDEKDGFGFISGNYGSPPRKSWLAIQTATLTLSVFAVRLAIVMVCRQYPGIVLKLADVVFGWVDILKEPGFIQLLSVFILPNAICSVQFVLTDHLIKYKRKRRWVPGDAELREIAMSAEVDEERDIEMYDLERVDETAHELPQFQHGLNSASVSYEVPVFTLSHSSDSGEIDDDNLDVTEHEEDDDDLYVESSRSNSTSSIEGIPAVSIRSPFIQDTSSLAASETSPITTSGIGMITASILSAAAANATASRLANRRPPERAFSISSTASSGQESETSMTSNDNSINNKNNSTDSASTNSSEDGELEPPSYDDSQREQRELLVTDSMGALRRALVIDEMKRNGA